QKVSLDNGKQNTSNFNRSDWGLKLGVGFEISQFQVAVAYRHGLYNLSKTVSKSIYNRGIEASLGYFFLR
ncbi:MAG: hypothetical protein ACRCSB_03530, partial [Bacteroidales bacterium]